MADDMFQYPGCGFAAAGAAARVTSLGDFIRRTTVSLGRARVSTSLPDVGGAEGQSPVSSSDQALRASCLELRGFQKEIWSAAIDGGRRHNRRRPEPVKHFSRFAGLLDKTPRR